VVRITAAKLDGTAVYMDFMLPVLNNDIILFTVQKQRNHQSHYKVEAKGGREATEKGLEHSVLFNISNCSSNTTREHAVSMF
jgi:hypothetical protein